MHHRIEDHNIEDTKKLLELAKQYASRVKDFGEYITPSKWLPFHSEIDVLIRIIEHLEELREEEEDISGSLEDRLTMTIDEMVRRNWNTGIKKKEEEDK